MRTYIIDAFNVAHKLPKIRDSRTPHNDLIHYIWTMGLTGSRNNKVIVVFDGYEPPDIAIDRVFSIEFGGVRSADEIIKKKILTVKERSQCFVVTDDRDIRDFAKKEGVCMMGVAEFLTDLGKKSQTSEVDDDLKEVDKEAITEELKRVWGKSPFEKGG